MKPNTNKKTWGGTSRKCIHGVGAQGGQEMGTGNLNKARMEFGGEVLYWKSHTKVP